MKPIGRRLYRSETARASNDLAEYADYHVALDRLRDKDDPVISSAGLRKRIARRKD